jgi:hypothetical protein
MSLAVGISRQCRALLDESGAGIVGAGEATGIFPGHDGGTAVAGRALQDGAFEQSSGEGDHREVGR